MYTGARGCGSYEGLCKAVLLKHPVERPGDIILLDLRCLCLLAVCGEMAVRVS